MPRLVSSPLTDVAVRKARPRSQRYDLYDAGLRGLGLRVAVSGTKSWFVMRRINGRMVRHTLGRYPDLSLSEVRVKAADALRQMASGKNPRSKNADLFEAVIKEWLLRDQAKNRSVDTVRKALNKHALPAFRGNPINTIRKADVLRLIDKIADSGAPVQANRVLAYLRRFFNWCIERDLIGNSPTTGIKAPAREIGRERVLSLEELLSVMGAATRLGYPWGAMVSLMVLSGQRLEEVANATWDEIDLGHCEWRLSGKRTKNGRPHLIHLSETALAVITGLPTFERQRWLFSTTGKGPVKGFSKAKARLDQESGVTGWTFHDLRRSFATHATETLNINPVVIDKVLNHTSGIVKGVAAVYQRGEYLEQRRAAMSAWATLLATRNTTNVTALRAKAR